MSFSFNRARDDDGLHLVPSTSDADRGHLESPPIMRVLVWLLRALVFFALFAFALNNQQAVVVKGFFGLDWEAPLVIVVLIAFAAGCALGVAAMMPSWWRQRRATARQRPTTAPPAVERTAPTAATATASDLGPEHPPREGL